MFQEFPVVCEGLHEEWEVFKEINNQANSAVDNSMKLVQEYEDYIFENDRQV